MGGGNQFELAFDFLNSSEKNKIKVLPILNDTPCSITHPRLILPCSVIQSNLWDINSETGGYNMCHSGLAPESSPLSWSPIFTGITD